MYNTFTMCKTTIFTGKINSGKTTRVLKTAVMLEKRGNAVGGIISVPQLREGKKYAYYAYDILSKEAALLATTEPIENSIRLSRFFFALSGFKFAEEAIKSAMSCDFLILDEAGPLELRGDGFADVLTFIAANYRGAFILTLRENILEEIISLFPLSCPSHRILSPDKEFTL